LRLFDKLPGSAFFLGLLFAFPSISSAQFIETKWSVTGYFGELWFAKERDIIGKHQEFFKGWADGVFYSCDYAGQSATYTSYTISDFLKNREFEIFSQENVFSKVFAENSLIDKTTKVFVHRITCNGKSVSKRKVLYPFVTVENSSKGFYIYEGAVFILEFDR